MEFPIKGSACCSPFSLWCPAAQLGSRVSVVSGQAMQGSAVSLWERAVESAAGPVCRVHGVWMCLT